MRRYVLKSDGAIVADYDTIAEVVVAAFRLGQTHTETIHDPRFWVEDIEEGRHIDRPKLIRVLHAGRVLDWPDHHREGGPSCLARKWGNEIADRWEETE